MATVKKIENGKVELSCKIDGEKWTNAVKKAFNKISKDFEIKGFRKGQVPENILKQHVKDEQIQLEACQDLAQDTLIDAVKENDVDIIDRPEMKIESINNNECNIIFTCLVAPDIELDNYKDIKYVVDDATVDAGEVNAELERYREQKSNLELKEEGTLEKDDVATIDFEGFKDGVAFEGGKGENYDLTIGSGQFIPGFEEQLIGMKSEEEKEIDVTFPENYQAEDLKGKAVKFKVKLHEIKKKVLPELNDEFVKELKIDKVETLDQFKDYIKDNLLRNKKADAENKASNKLVDDLLTKIKVDLPEVMIKNEQEQMFRDYGQRLAQQGIPFDQFLKLTGQDEEKFKEGLKDEAIKRIKTTLGLKEIAKRENIEVVASDIENYYKKVAEQYNMAVDEIKKYIDESQIKSDLKLQKALDFLKK